MSKKRSFFERLTGSVRVEEIEDENDKPMVSEKRNNAWMEEENEDAELAVDVYQTHSEIIVQTFVAGVKPDAIDLTIARDMITISGKREENKNIDEENYFTKELYWGSFSRTILLPQEIEPEETEATEKNGLMTIKLYKIDKEKKMNVKVKSV